MRLAELERRMDNTVQHKGAPFFYFPLFLSLFLSEPLQANQTSMCGNKLLKERFFFTTHSPPSLTLLTLRFLALIYDFIFLSKSFFFLLILSDYKVPMLPPHPDFSPYRTVSLVLSCCPFPLTSVLFSPVPPVLCPFFFNRYTASLNSLLEKIKTLFISFSP